MQRGPSQVTIESLISPLLGGARLRTVINWPPDVFAVVAVLLQKSGAYIRVVSDWPPSEYSRDPNRWTTSMESLGRKWRNACNRKELPPHDIQKWWRQFLSYKDTLIERIPDIDSLCSVLIQLLSVADEACAGVGIPDSSNPLDNFHMEVLRCLYLHKTCARMVAPALYCVLPKLHTPQTGITLRSLSHYLALCSVGEVNPSWGYFPAPRELQESSSLNLLLVPWPREISALEFESAATDPQLKNLPDSMGFFSFSPRSDWSSVEFRRLLQNAISDVGRVDGVIFPELSFKSVGEFNDAVSIVRDVSKAIFLVGGVGGRSASGKFDVNCVRFIFPTVDEALVIEGEQHKHHRWKLDEAQIRQYGLTHRLDPYKMWWENTELKSRDLNFFSILPWLTCSLLICEDLARQDPVADLLRSVGPNLVVALLMDGPQLQGRWSSRYATVFADDPGSSVLALTSLGMSKRSKPALGSNQLNRERTIGIWKDAGGAAREIDLPEGADGVVLTLNRMYRTEWSADGRNDGEAAAYLTLGAVHPIKSAAPV